MDEVLVWLSDWSEVHMVQLMALLSQNPIISCLILIETDYYRAMLCIRGTSHEPVSVCLSQVGVLLKRLNVGSHKQHHTIAQGL